MTAQAAGKAFDNLETLLRESGASLADVVRSNYYVTDIDGFFGAMEVIGLVWRGGLPAQLDTAGGRAARASAASHREGDRRP